MFFSIRGSALLLSTTLVFAACGGGDGQRSQEAGCVPAVEARADVDGASVAVAIAARDDRFEPRCVELPAGHATLVVRNEGRHPHNLTLPNGDSIAIDAGQVAFLETTVDADLRYTCTIHPGMDGELRIVE